MHSADLRVLIGPTYLDAVQRVQWPGATVRYLQKYRDRMDGSASNIPYDEASLKQAIAGRPVRRELADFILALNHDPNCFFLVERDRTDLFKGSFLAPVDISDAARYAWQILEDERPRVLVFHNHPHELFTYVLLKAALRLNITVLLVHYAAMPWRMAISRYGSNGQPEKQQLRQVASEVERNAVRGYMQRLQRRHEDAIPFADRKLLADDSLYVGDEWRAMIKGAVPKNALRIFKKRRSYRAFNRWVTSDGGIVGGKPYVVFLMHYQPEETTVPRGDVYGQQLNALLKLRSELPDDISILVKENKATFRAQLVLSVDVRSDDFYRALSGLPDTYLVPLSHDTFELVDNSVAVATITGSVGLEALCRGKKVIIFGEANYKGFAGVIDLSVTAPRGAGLGSLRALGPHDPALTESDLMQELLSSIGPAEEANDTNLLSQQAATIDAFGYVAERLQHLLDSPLRGRMHG